MAIARSTSLARLIVGRLLLAARAKLSMSKTRRAAQFLFPRLFGSPLRGNVACCPSFDAKLATSCHDDQQTILVRKRRLNTGENISTSKASP